MPTHFWRRSIGVKWSTESNAELKVKVKVASRQVHTWTQLPLCWLVSWLVSPVLCQVLTSDSALTEISPSPTLHPVTRTGLISGAVTDTRWLLTAFVLISLSPDSPHATPPAADWRLRGKLIDGRKTSAIITAATGPESATRRRQIPVRAGGQRWWSLSDRRELLRALIRVWM